MRTLIILAASFAVAGFLGLVAGGEDLPAHERPVVAELFTSQGCSSCPPAEAVFRNLAAREDVIAIEWHVDYWDTLVHGRAGSWKDPYSSTANTERQRDYNQVLRATRSVYTPQAVIGGVFEAVGSRGGQVNRLIATAPDMVADVSVQTNRNGQFSVHISGNIQGEADIRYVRLLPRQSTDVLRGENHGQTLASANIALASEVIGTWSGSAAPLSAPQPRAGETCAILVQERTRGGPGRILGASYCPARA